MRGCISVIVPIYKVEPYLNRAIDSIRNQSYENLEIILVDDGSPDSCGAICDEYALKDRRIKVIHKQNGGLSDARNAGLDIATGDYIAFVDSDDYIAKDFLQKLYEALLEEDADVSMCPYVVTDCLEASKDIFEKEVTSERIVSDSQQLMRNMYDSVCEDATYYIVSWNKLYNANLWEGIRFPKGKIHEDEATTYRIYDRAKKGVYIKQPLYAYYSAEESITRAKFQLKRLDWMDALNDRIAYYEKAGQEELVKLAIKARADAAIHYYYPLKEAFPTAKEEQRNLKSYVKVGREQSASKLGYTIFLWSAPLYRMLTCVDRDRKERIYQLLFVLLTAWLCFLCFYKLDVKYVDPWDESRHGVNAYEMQKENHLIESTYLYETDYYNLKPPLSMWSIMLSMKIFGTTVFALRFPSALFYILLAVITAVFVRKRYNRIAAILVLAFLSANTTPFLAHMIRAGDADSLYVFLFTLAMLCMMKIKEKQSDLYWCGFLFSLAFLTKSYHAGIIAVVGGLYLLISGEFKKIKPIVWIKFMLSAVTPIGLWVIARLGVDGISFFKEMIVTDVLGRSQKGFGSNEAGFSFYFEYFLGKMSGTLQSYFVLLLFLLLAIILCIEYKLKGNTIQIKLKDALAFSLWILVPCLAFSAVTTKLLWYQYPTVTGLCIITAILVGCVIEQHKERSFISYTIIFLLLGVSLYFSLDTASTIHNYGIEGQQTNDFQIFLKELGTTAIEEVKGTDAYLIWQEESEEEVKTTWSQQDVYIAEAYGDFKCQNSRLEDFISDQEKQTAVAIVTRNYYEEVLRLLDMQRNIRPELQKETDKYVAIWLEKN